MEYIFILPPLLLSVLVIALLFLGAINGVIGAKSGT